MVRRLYHDRFGTGRGEEEPRRVNIVDLAGVEKHYGERALLSQVTFALDERDKVGLIGRNGCGKSTLLRIVTGLEDADSGQLHYKRQSRVVYLSQQPEFETELTVRAVLEQGLAEVYERHQRYRAVGKALEMAPTEAVAELLAEQQQLQQWFDVHGAWQVEHRIAQLCDRLGIGDLEQTVGQLSGGQLKRVALARVLLEQPDLLLLDEPTNHLDAQTILWLEQELINYPGAVLLVTHDRYFLDRVVTRMFELDQGLLTLFRGCYTDYLEQKSQLLEQQQQQQSRLLNILRREEAWLKRGAKARTTKQKARIGRVDELREQKQAPQRGELAMAFSAEQRLGGTILELDHVRLQAGDRPLVDDLSLILRPGERLGILGPNGSGKSTLLKTVLGEVPLVGGTVTLGRKTTIGYIDQQRSGLDPDLQVAEVLGEGEWVTVAGQKRYKIGYLEDFLFSPLEQRKLVATLSGGERARLLLAKLMMQGANLLILDEPTNDLDIPTLQVLEQALIDFGGCVLVVTHDRYLLDRVATAILAFDGRGQATRYAGNYSDMLLQQAAGEQATREIGRDEKKSAEKTPDKVERPRKKGLSFKEKRELEELERQIDELEQEKQRQETLLSQSHQATAEQLAQAGCRFAELEEQLLACFERWEELEQKREEAL
ncbi:MAG: ABC-F family ATP-binding cassette domain-containing protein [Desulfuromonadaceae bacterium]|nr:ABC-F family ATP-binding cassette domain-containing protein [Desulfuromonadaceae bacterium]